MISAYTQQARLDKGSKTKFWEDMIFRDRHMQKPDSNWEQNGNELWEQRSGATM